MNFNINIMVFSPHTVWTKLNDDGAADDDGDHDDNNDDDQISTSQGTFGNYIQPNSLNIIDKSIKNKRKGDVRDLK